MPNDDQIADLMAQVAAGDRAAFRALYSATAPKLLAVLIRMLPTRAEAEDALQDVFTRVWQRAGRYDAERGRAMTWLIAVARNHAIDRLRSRPEAVADDDGAIEAMVDPTPGPERRMVAAGQAREIADCFDQLEPARADAVRGAYLQGLSYADLAAAQGVPINTMRTWLRRSLLALRACMEGFA